MAPQRGTGSGAEAELPEYSGQYRLESCLGSGGMGVVHLATSTSGLRLAVKVVHAEFAKDPEFRGRFRQEVAAARQVSGAFTAPVVDADTDSARPWMATLFIPGPTLAEHVKRNGPMPPGQLRRLMAGLAEALRDIHRAGVVHRDLKPSNVLLAEDGPKVIDFGISRPKDSELRTETGKLIGTPPFMAPEQFRRPREVGPAADIFALGSVTVHAATGRGPFDSDSPYVVAYQVVHDEPDLTDVPENLAPLVRACLAKEPEDRPTADDLMHELRSVAASYDTQTFVTTQREREGAGWASSPGQAADKDTRDGTGRGTWAGKDTGAGSAPGTGADTSGSRDGADGRGHSGRGDRAGGRPRRRAVLVAATLVLVVGGGFASVRALGGDGGRSGGDTPRPRASGAAAATPALEAWATRPAAKEKSAPQCSYGAGKLLCVQPGLVSALDPADGSVLWRHTVGGAGAVGTGDPPVEAGGLVQVLTDRGRRVQALDPGTGKVRWQRDISSYGGKRYVGGTLLLTAADGTVTGVDGATGDTLWSGRIPGQPEAYFTSFDGDRSAYVASVTGEGAGTRTRITAVDPDTGDVRWDARLEGRLEPVGAQDGVLFLTAIGGAFSDTVDVVRYDPGTGATVRFALPVRLEQARAVVRDDVVYLLSGAGGSLVAVDMKARKQLWRTETGVARGSAPVADDRHVYFTSSDGRLLAVDLLKGRISGDTPSRLGGSDRVTGSLPEPVIIDGRVCAGALDGTVLGLDGSDPASW
ncbi:serine/threonine-protein kinase [Streptomyces europaeiscabiei]|uniref:serine/threonine-protein kinase n=2 Tax=Streptomyces europaeiscabiei TaxID=146819 RepID=UPI0029ABFAF2|nr:serine/threonine-protein kinase [Streptomyces europaeiscabiei]MDX3631502.1 serine/threonine-protein kinase [Streptomyces europaeiscabiei]MDX3649283.1 serine/threonine-protein kinase [Streptomyces europaeiscabiei]